VSPREPSLYDRVGGEAYFVALVDRFYEGVERDPVLRPLYPADLGPGKANLAGFLAVRESPAGPADAEALVEYLRGRGEHARAPAGLIRGGGGVRALTANGPV